MVFPDVKVLVHAFRADDSHRAVSWLERIVHRNAQFLFAPEVLLGRLHADVSEKELDLLQFASRNMPQTRACAPQIVRCKVPDLSPSCELFHY